MPKESVHKWEFKARFRRQAFGWRSQPAILRLKQAVTEIKKVARKDSVLAAEGAVCLLERISPALENVDGSSGAIGAAVNRAIAEIVPIISAASADDKTRARWLERLYEAHAADRIPYIESLTDYWGELCASKETASAWADRLLPVTRMALSPDKRLRGHFHVASACLSSLFFAERYDELIATLDAEDFWHYKRWAVKALAAQGRNEEAIRLAESSRSPWASDMDIDQLCEAILHSMGRADEAYARYGIRAHRGGTFLATFRAVSRKYPDKRPADILTDLAKSTPGEEGKWFAAAKDVGLYEEALALASRSPCDPKTLTRAARDHAESQPTFALGAGLLALHWLLEGYGYEVTVADVTAAHALTMKAADRLGRVSEVEQRIVGMVQGKDGPVAEILRRGPGLRLM